MESTNEFASALAPRPGMVHGITVAVCTNRVENLRRWESVSFLKRLDVRLLVIVDCNPNYDECGMLAELKSMGAHCVVVGENRGLAAARNLALDQTKTEFVLFADDDVSVTTEAVDAVLAAFESGADLVGAWLVLPKTFPQLPWFVGPGHLHYLGVHNQAAGEQRCWGAFFGVRTQFAATAHLKFRRELGRKGGSLECGDDSQFVADVKAAGGTIEFLVGLEVHHHVSVDRLSIRYLMRRAYWQGISEARRCRCFAGLGKEFRRLGRISTKRLPAILSAGACAIAVLAGIVSGQWAMIFSSGNPNTGVVAPGGRQK